MVEISVIVPVYRVEQYLKKCIDSVLNQSFTDFELWLVDDGSPDNCGLICEEYAQIDSRVNVIHKNNGGLSAARNAALDVIRGKYVFFVDSDDWISNDALETLYNAINKYNGDVAVGNTFAAYENGNQHELYVFSNKERVLENEELLNTLLMPNACNKLYKREIFENLRYPIGRLYEDVFVYHKILSQVNRMVLTGKTSYYYLMRTGSIMNTEYNIRFTDIIDALYDRVTWLESIGQKEIANETRLFIYSQVAVAFAHLNKTKAKEKEKLNEIKKIYDECYEEMIISNTISFKQKVRLFILKEFPLIHTILWGRKMPINLGGQ